MAKKVSEIDATESKLILSINDFKKKIENRIKLGVDLLNTTVKRRASDNPYRKDVKYDEQEQSDFFSAYSKWNKFNTELLRQSFNKKENEYKKEYDDSEYMGAMFGSNDVISDQKKTIKKKNDTLESIIERLVIIPVESGESHIGNNSPQAVLTNKVFIVHGHNELTKQTTARTISQLGLDPIILHEQPDGGRTIIEKFEKNSSDIGFAIILLTDDDEGKAKSEDNYKPRARQNVIFEMGYFIGKLGRQRVLLLLEQGVEKPGDLDGIVYTQIDTNDGWKLKLFKELKACGYTVSADHL